jgi:hemerythrin superfamily protein
MDALELLRSDHDTVRDLFEQFESAKESGNTGTMPQLAEQIFHELEVHTAIEEEVFYPAARDVGGEAESLVLEGVEEHHVVDVLMNEIRGLDPSAEEWAAKMTVLIENVEHHAEEEEEELFPKLREAFGDARLERMGEELEAAKQRRENGSSTSNVSNVSNASKAELYEKAQQQDVSGRSSMTKEELAEAVDED